MATTRGKSPVLLTAVGDVMTLPADGPMHWLVTQIRVTNAAAAGDVLLLDRLGGRQIFRSNALAANTADGTSFGAPVWMDDLYVSSLPAGAVVAVFYC